MGTVQLAFLWHFPQTRSRDLPSRTLLMPWVRLHGIKDYTGLAAILEEFPKIRCTTNFSPVLLDQLPAHIAAHTPPTPALPPGPPPPRARRSAGPRGRAHRRPEGSDPRHVLLGPSRQRDRPVPALPPAPRAP